MIIQNFYDFLALVLLTVFGVVQGIMVSYGRKCSMRQGKFSLWYGAYRSITHDLPNKWVRSGKVGKFLINKAELRYWVWVFYHIMILSFFIIALGLIQLYGHWAKEPEWKNRPESEGPPTH